MKLLIYFCLLFFYNFSFACFEKNYNELNCNLNIDGYTFEYKVYDVRLTNRSFTYTYDNGVIAKESIPSYSIQNGLSKKTVCNKSILINTSSDKNQTASFQTSFSNSGWHSQGETLIREKNCDSNENCDQEIIYKTNYENICTI